MCLYIDHCHFLALHQTGKHSLHILFGRLSNNLDLFDIDALGLHQFDTAGVDVVLVFEFGDGWADFDDCAADLCN